VPAPAAAAPGAHEQPSNNGETEVTSDRRIERRLLALNAVLLALLLAVGLWSFWAIVPKPWRDHDPAAEPRPVTARGELAELETTAVEVFRSAAPAVVHITTLASATGLFSLDV
jgi:ferric-dicitrate binding protein FerR (iron transport regulator)